MFSIYGDYRELSDLSINQEKLIILLSTDVNTTSLPKSTQEQIKSLKSSISENQKYSNVFDKPTPIIGILLIIFGASLAFGNNFKKV
jgi:hypothetical protein